MLAVCAGHSREQEEKIKFNTTMADKNQIIQDFTNYIGSESYSGWYVGIASDLKKRLFNDHNVSESQGAYISRNAGSADTAREIEEYFLDLGADGGGGGGDDSSQYVYAYRKTSSTKEDN